MKSAFDEVQIGDLVLVHGIIGVVVEKLEGAGFIYQPEFGEAVAYNRKWPIQPVPKRLWICEQ